MTQFIAYPARHDVRTVPCPACGSLVGEKCVGARDKLRESNHQERVDAHQKLLNVDETP